MNRFKRMAVVLTVAAVGIAPMAAASAATHPSHKVIKTAPVGTLAVRAVQVLVPRTVSVHVAPATANLRVQVTDFSKSFNLAGVYAVTVTDGTTTTTLTNVAWKRISHVGDGKGHVISTYRLAVTLPLAFVTVKTTFHVTGVVLNISVASVISQTAYLAKLNHGQASLSKFVVTP